MSLSYDRIDRAFKPALNTKSDIDRMNACASFDVNVGNTDRLLL